MPKVSDALFAALADALCPWRAGFSRTREVVGEKGLDFCWAFADGYGHLPLATLRARGLARDWSHVRDSSDVALLRIAGYLGRRGLLPEEVLR